MLFVKTPEYVDILYLIVKFEQSDSSVCIREGVCLPSQPLQRFISPESRLLPGLVFIF